MDQAVYEEAHNRAMQGIEDMLFEVENPMGHFKKTVYTGQFEEYCQKYGDVIKAVETVYQMEEQPEEWCRTLAEHLTQEASKRLNDIPKKGQRNDTLLGYNMALAVYVFPAFLETKDRSAEAVTDAIVEVWNKQFHTTVGKASYEKIVGGFQKKLCYITTAVCECLGKEDDCYELKLLRDYRDGYLMATKGGEALVEEYYNIAPTIVTRINREECAANVYREIWSTYLKPCIRYIEEKRLEDCKVCYMNMVMDLKGRYIA